MKNFKKNLLLVVLLASFNFVACGGDSTKTADDYAKEIAESTCHKIFTCDEGEDYRSFYGGTEDKCVESVLKSEDDSNSTDSDNDCKDINHDMADKCVSCYKNLSCAETFSDNGSDKCNEYCDNVCNDPK